jgi:hypothetical protein
MRQELKATSSYSDNMSIAQHYDETDYGNYKPVGHYIMDHEVVALVKDDYGLKTEEECLGWAKESPLDPFMYFSLPFPSVAETVFCCGSDEHLTPLLEAGEVSINGNLMRLEVEDVRGPTSQWAMSAMHQI